MSSKTCVFFEEGSHAQFEYVLAQYDEALKAKAHDKSSKPENLIKLDKWYQTELPKKIKSRGKEPFLTHDEIVQCIKWKLARGQFRPRLKDLVQMNTPRVVMQETKKAFRNLYKRNDIESAVAAMSNLKGVGPAMASAVLAAGAPHLAPFMADECLLSLPEMEGIDYTLKEYLRLVEKTNECVERLNSQGGSWTPHQVELAVWTHYVARELKPDLLEDMPGSSSKGKTSLSPVKKDGGGGTTDSSPTKETTNGVNGVHTTNSEEEATTAADTPTADTPAAVAETATSDNSNDTSAKEDENVAKTSTVTTTSDNTAAADEDSSQKSEEARTEAPKEAENTEKTPTEEKEEKAEKEESPKVNGATENAHQENGSHNNSSQEDTSSSTKEEILNGESAKRPLESEDSEELSEAKRLKEEASQPSVPAQPIQAN